MAHVVGEYCSHAQRVLIDPDIENVPIMRVCEKYGFIRVALLQAGRRTHAVLAVHVRTSVRAVIVNPDNEVLLMKLHPPQRGMFWCAIGGRIEAAETHMQALKREIAQETGFCDYNVGRLLGVGEHTFFQGTIATRCIAWFYEVHTCQREVAWEGLTADEQNIVQAYAWWPAEALCASRATVYPTDLCQLMRMDWSQSHFPVLLYM